MSKIALQGDASGTGTFTIASPNSNTDRTLTLPDEAGTILTTSSDVLTSASDITSQAMNGPAFEAYNNSGSNQGITSGSFTKAYFDATSYDTDSAFDTSNYRFQPSVEGYYQINAQLYFGDAVFSETLTSIFKNGNRTKDGSAIFFSSANATGSFIQASSLVYMNGSTDYIEIYAYCVISSGTPRLIRSNDAVRTYVNGYLARAV
jgi:hypothetical protein